MEHGKLERMQRALDQWVQEHPEEVRRLQERAKPLAEFLDSSEWDAFWQPAKAAISRDDETGRRAWVEDRIGLDPDPVLHPSASECQGAGRGHTSSDLGPSGWQRVQVTT